MSTTAANMAAKARKAVDEGRVHPLTDDLTCVVSATTGELYLIAVVPPAARHPLHNGTGTVPPAWSCTCIGFRTQAPGPERVCSHVLAVTLDRIRQAPLDDPFAGLTAADADAAHF